MTDISKFVDENIANQQKRFFATEIENLKTRSTSHGGRILENV